MKILFICSSLEPGRDGVGDYTRRIAGEFIRQGHSAAIIALNDKCILEKVTENQEIENNTISVLRLPTNMPIESRLAYAKIYIDYFNPEWLSLQFVIFGFHPRGLPFAIGKRLKTLGEGRRWHIMFHELWLGMEMEAGTKHLIWGYFQRLIIKSLILDLKPAIIHSHTGLYLQHLGKLGFNALHLALTGNIPNVNNQIRDQVIDPLKRISFVIFGNIHAGAPLADFVEEARKYADKYAVELSLIFIGRQNVEQEKFVYECKFKALPFQVLGEQPAREISLTFERADIGISTTPLALIEKSGSVAAMHEHGLPVICLHRAWQPRLFNKQKVPEGISSYVKGNLEMILKSKLSFLVKNNPSDIVNKMMNDLLTIC